MAFGSCPFDSFLYSSATTECPTSLLLHPAGGKTSRQGVLGPWPGPGGCNSVRGKAKWRVEHSSHPACSRHVSTQPEVNLLVGGNTARAGPWRKCPESHLLRRQSTAKSVTATWCCVPWDSGWQRGVGSCIWWTVGVYWVGIWLLARVWQMSAATRNARVGQAHWQYMLLCTLVSTESQTHRVVWVERNFKGHPVPACAMGSDSPHYTTVPKPTYHEAKCSSTIHFHCSNEVKDLHYLWLLSILSWCSLKALSSQELSCRMGSGQRWDAQRHLIEHMGGNEKWSHIFPWGLEVRKTAKVTWMS